MPVMCNDCPHDFIADLPAALIVLVPKDPELSLVGGCLCRRCLVREDVLEVIAVTFDQIVPGARLEALLVYQPGGLSTARRPENAPVPLRRLLAGN